MQLIIFYDFVYIMSKFDKKNINPLLCSLCGTQEYMTAITGYFEEYKEKLYYISRLSKGEGSLFILEKADFFPFPMQNTSDCLQDD